MRVRVVSGNTFCLTVEYDKQSPNPEKIFLGIAKTLEAFKALDAQLITCVDSSIETDMLLEDVERGSIKLWLANVLKSIPDNAIENLDYKKIVGSFLIKAKYLVLSKCSDTELIKDVSYVEEIENGVKDIAKATGVNALECYSAPPREGLLQGIQKVSEAFSSFDNKNTVTMTDDEGNSLVLNTGFCLEAETIEKLCTGEIIENDMELIVKVRKPDFLADTNWVFKHGEQTIHAKIEDKKWLSRYLNGEIVVLPGDSLRVKMHIISSYGNNQALLRTKYEVTKVINIVHKETIKEMPLM